MQLSTDTQSVLATLDQAIEGGLRKRADIGVILELAAMSDAHELMNEMFRTGKGLYKVYSLLRKQQQNAQGYIQLEQEFALQLNSLREQLAQLTHRMDDATLKRFDDIYFAMGQGVIRNLVDLGHDLARIKDLQA